jgi:hypothetical protein
VNSVTVSSVPVGNAYVGVIEYVYPERGRRIACLDVRIEERLGLTDDQIMAMHKTELRLRMARLGFQWFEREGVLYYQEVLRSRRRYRTTQIEERRTAAMQ